jgi:hypothetical protein
MRDVECRATKGGREKDSRVVIPRSRVTPVDSPKGAVLWGMYFLETDHMCQMIAKKTEEQGAFVKVSQALNIKSQNLKR